MGKKKSRRERWPGGYIHHQLDGQPLFIIEREVDGRRYHVSTKAHGWKAALEQLAAFESHPPSYKPGGGKRSGALYLTEELAEEFEAWHAKKVSAKYAKETANRLADWREALEGRDLRRLSLPDDIDANANGRGGRRPRVVAIKLLFKWLRLEKRLVTRAQDVTLDIALPPSVPEKTRRRKVVELAVVRAAAAHLAPVYRDYLQLKLATSWHCTECARFIRGPSEIVAPPRPMATAQGRPLLAVLVVKHKSGNLTRTPISDERQLEAIRRLQARGVVPRRLNATLADACKAAEVPAFKFGVLRHSVLTWGVEAGADMHQASQFAGHRDKSTTERFYVDLAAPTADIPTVVL